MITTIARGDGAVRCASKCAGNVVGARVYRKRSESTLASRPSHGNTYLGGLNRILILIIVLDRLLALSERYLPAHLANSEQIVGLREPVESDDNGSPVFLGTGAAGMTVAIRLRGGSNDGNSSFDRLEDVVFRSRRMVP